MLDESFPLWAAAGIHPSGGAYESLDFDGRAVSGDEARVRVQARQLYSFSLAHELGWQPATSKRLAAGLLGILTEGCRRGDGLYGRRVNLAERRLTDETADLYDTAFALLALATARGVLGAAAVDTHIALLLHALDAELARAEGGYAEFLPAPRHRLQNPHMHLFESLLALHAATGDAAVRGRVETLRTFIESTFFNEEYACVDEVADPADDSQSACLEPGHSMEWVWLLGRHARLAGTPYPDFGRKLYARALETLDPSGRAVMQVATSGESLDASRRLWSQTETLKAHLCIMEHGKGDDVSRAAASAARCADGLFHEWLLPAVAGGWLDHFGADGRLCAKDMPASSGYHVYCAIAELMRLTRRR